jgi:hypothetical protein
MSFIRRYNDKNKEPPLKLFINFFFRVLPSFFIVTFIFFYFYFLSEATLNYMRNDISFNRTRFQHYNKNLANCYYCMKNTKALIPFLLQYMNIKGDTEDKECFQFMIFMTNLLYCYLIVILLVYLSFKIKSKVFDFFIIAILLINYLSNYISCKSIEGYIININLLFGEQSSIKYTHLFFNYYFLGFLIGLSFFYNNDITHENSLQNWPIYKPFNFMHDIIRFIYLRSFTFKLLIIIVTIVIQFLLSASFFYYTKFSILNAISSANENKLNLLDNIWHVYEKNIFAIAFGLMLIVFYTFNSSVFKGFCNNTFFIVFNRISVGYYSFIEILINSIYCIIELEVQLNSTNILFITCGIIFYLIVSSIFLVILYEIPVKIIIKKILHINNGGGSEFKI